MGNMSDATLIAMITDVCNAYKPPVLRRATNADIDAAQTDFDRRIQTESVPGHREQVEYGAKKRIKP